MIFDRHPLLLSRALAVLALLALAGCEEGNYATYADEDSLSPVIEIAPVPPPAASEEIKIGLTDTRSQVWRPGHWVYEDQRFAWVPGEVITRPAPFAVWSPDRWEHRTYGWVFIHGYWQ